MTTRTTAASALMAAMTLIATGCTASNPAPGASGRGVIDLSGGGSAATSQGGAAGSLFVETNSPAGVTLSRSGVADASFAIPAWPGEVDLGANGVTVALDTAAVRLPAGSADPGAGVLYVVENETTLYRADGAGTVPDASETVTGFRVVAGATFRIAPNLDTDLDGLPDMTIVTFSADVELSGTLAAESLMQGDSSLPQDRSGLWVSAGRIFIASGAKIDALGGDAAAGSDERGGNGGAIRLEAVAYFQNEGAIDASGGRGDGAGPGGNAAASFGRSMFVGASGDVGPGVVVNRGTIRAAGGDGASGGDGAEIDVLANGPLFNAGVIVEKGGTGSNGLGGSGNWPVQLLSGTDAVFSSGEIVAEGGSGTAGGGAGGHVRLSAGGCSDALNSASVTVNGGDAIMEGDGGLAGQIELRACTAIRTSGALSLDGGAGKGVGHAGGGGGGLSVRQLAADAAAATAIRISGNISAIGGACDGGAGGPGGSIQVYQSFENPADAAGAEVVGYARVVLKGGDGEMAGGDDGHLELQSETNDRGQDDVAVVPSNANVAMLRD